ncbi:N-methylhydantoinase A [Crossiella equi]|uniref:N-methylhydantoinase A n=1 Tax=Crossiella equi TaxID=130796 RepID=A0ABS5AE52_9PSEU|nr:hydantoinase/oxoprolinase family protein [Crossiella equi]MBP2474606.1 N-methylhydantoinase A [Crossiella equi]
MGGYRLGVDVGDTFTDVLLVDERTGAAFRAKCPTTPHNLAAAVLNGIRDTCRAAGVDPTLIGHVLHGGTAAGNAILQGSGARVGLVTTTGFRQVLQLARSYAAEPLARPEDTIEVTERIAADGVLVRPLDTAAARIALRRLRAARVEALTISLLNAVANDSHERLLGELAAEELPGIPVTLSAHALHEPREYERTATAVVNSYLRPLAAKTQRDLAEALASAGIPARVSVPRNDGRPTTAGHSVERPIATLSSGRAGGVRAAAHFAALAGYPDVLTLDLGGSSADVALVRDGQVPLERHTSVGDLTVRAPGVDVHTIALGGCSLVRVSKSTMELRIGPASAGAMPGPISYRNGGTKPTVTDVNLALGYLPDAIAGGRVKLDVAGGRKAVAALADALALPSPERAAGEVLAMVNDKLFRALRLVAVRNGHDPHDFPLVVFGGAGPLHANALARIAGTWPVIVPPSPGTLGAYGLAGAEPNEEAVAPGLAGAGPARLHAVLAELVRTASDRLLARGVPREQLCAQADLTVRGAGGLVTELLAEVDEKVLAAEDPRVALGIEPDAEVQALRVVVRGPRPAVHSHVPLPGRRNPIPDALLRQAKIVVDAELVAADVYDRAKLLAGNVVSGPALIVEPDSTTLVQPGHAATVHATGCLLINPE